MKVHIRGVLIIYQISSKIYFGKVHKFIFKKFETNEKNNEELLIQCISFWNIN